MKNGYDQFFKNARQAADQSVDQRGGPRVQKKTAAPAKVNFDLSRDEMEQQIRRRMGVKKTAKKKKSFPWKMTGFSLIGFVLAVYGFQNYDQMEKLLKNVEITVGTAQAETPPAPAAKKADAKSTEARDPASIPENTEAKAAEASANSNLDLDHLTKLNDRKKELDAREEELNRLEAELQVQKQELDKRMKDLEEMRTKISSILEERVKVDETKVDTLVQMYSNMKATQAAKIFETMDEDLAVEILGRMKKKSAADIMNLLKPEKAQVFSEKYAGYKRR